MPQPVPISSDKVLCRNPIGTDLQGVSKEKVVNKMSNYEILRAQYYVDSSIQYIKDDSPNT